MNNLQQRILTGIMLIFSTMLLIHSGVYPFLLLLLLINFGGILELYRLLRIGGVIAVLGAFTGSLLITTITLILNGSLRPDVLLLHVPLLFAFYMVELYKHSPEPFKNLAYAFIAILFVSLPLCFFSASAFLPNGNPYNDQLVSGCFLMIWANDTGAYLSGKYWGMHLLFKRISPHKTWEGSVGGCVASLLTALTLSGYLKTLPLSGWISLSLIISVTGTYGDLFKSMLKRSVHVKDTGKLLPGHGGILDRFDSLLGSAPFIFTYLFLYGFSEI